ncbi:baseplate wedge subunit [uncultured Caudovirales phage]|uniref:Baseplate wedge subunit n=1 Tax=uncultured Caudovirales phage TaxID=2100421 RepID=A0A6J5LFS6_9CAUD|nr:baseplate wedge subunit [uncultured Caudovirales phage]
MATSNTNTQVSDLDFNSIKSNFTKYLQSQDTFKDYNFQGSALSVLLDILAYNTQYNAYYLNMVGNEMFLDSALQRSSVVSHAKLLNYTPKSAIAPTAFINLTVNSSAGLITIPKNTNFMSEAIDGVNYNFVTVDSTTVPVSSGVATFGNLELKQGIPGNISYTVNSTLNPSYTFEILDSNVDTTTLQVIVQNSSTDTTQTVYQLATNFLELTPTSTVYYLQEALNGNYQIYFGDGILGSKLADGNIVYISYISTDGSMASGANNFVLMDSIPNLSSYTVSPQVSATTGGGKESIDSIKFQAPKSYSTQGRAVTTEDYITIIQQNKLGFAFDAVNVWGGESNDPPVYGQVFISLKPSGAYTLTDIQKQLLVDTVIKPISVMTVKPNIVDPDYTYVKTQVSVLYNPKKTTSTASQVQSDLITTIQNYLTSTLNTFNSTFNSYGLLSAVQNYDNSIIGSDYKLQLQKKFYPNLTTPTDYTFNFGVPLTKGILFSGLTSFPSMTFVDPSNVTNQINGVYLEEIPSAIGGVTSINIVNPGISYQYPPVVTIIGDGSGAAAVATLNPNGSIRAISILDKGANYSSAAVVITPQEHDLTGQLGAATAILEGQYGTIQSYYNSSTLGKVILNANAGSIDYVKGTIRLYSFYPISIDNPLGQLTITVHPDTSIISSSLNRIITLDPYDSTAVEVILTEKTN